MRPFHHAKASSARDGRPWREDLEVHEFLDSSKLAFADLRHRLILHSADLGMELAKRVFPDRSDIRTIVENHLLEDMGEVRTLSQWLARCNLNALPRLHPGSRPVDERALLDAEQKRLGLPDQAGPKAVLEILRLPSTVSPEYEEHAWCILGNSFGPYLVRRILGGPAELESESGPTVIFDPAWCAEGIIYHLFRTIPEVRTVAMALRTSCESNRS